MRMKLNLKQQKVGLELSSKTIITADHSKLLNIEAHASGHTGFVYDEDFAAYKEEVKIATRNLQARIDNLDVGYIIETEMQQHLAEQAAINKAQDDILNTEITTREEADTTLQTNLDIETQARKQSDNDLQTALSAEVIERAKDDDMLNLKIENETKRAINAENTLQSHIDTYYSDQAIFNATLQDKDDKLNALIENVNNKLDDETSIRQTKDTILQQNIDTNTTKIINNLSLINNEASYRQTADNILQNNINANTTLINQETNNRQASDIVFNTQITKNSEDITDLGTQLNEEIFNRKSANFASDFRLSAVETRLTTETTNRIKDDDTLHDLIVAEQTNRENADAFLRSQVYTNTSTITTEINDRQTADNILQNNINNEKIARQNANVILQTNIDNEIQTRKAKDVVLQTNIDNETSARENADNDLQTQINQLKGLGGYLTAYDFRTSTPTQDDLTNYAMSQLSITDKLEIFNMTRVTNLYDKNLWILTNTQDTNPTVFEWSNNGNDTVSIATEDVSGILKSSSTRYELKVDSVKQTASINGLETKLNIIDAKNFEQDTRFTNIESIDTQQNTRLDTIEAKNFEQDTSINDLENNKLDKVIVSQYTYAYITNEQGQGKLQVVQGDANANTIPLRTNNGQVITGTPTADTHAATKKYVDDNKMLFDTNIPKMNGTASVGLSTSVSRGDHVHPSDTSKANLDGWTANRVIITSASGALTAGSITSAELEYLSGVSSNLQTQLNGKLSTRETAADSNKLGGQLPSYYLDYNNLINTPIIPIKMSQLTNDGNYVNDTSYVHTDNNFTTTLLNKLNGIAAEANNYVHPANHPASIITQDANNRFVSDAEKAIWNAKSDFSGAYTDLTEKPITMPNPNAITFTGYSTGSYTGAAALTINIPTSLPASDVYAWAKASTKPTYTKAEVGLGNVDNIADVNKSVKFASNAAVSTLLAGFISRSTTHNRGNQIGTAITYFNDSTGGSIGWRRDNPTAGKMSMIINGTVYVDEGQNAVWHSGNFNPSSYLPLSGGVLNGTLTIGGTTSILKIGSSINNKARITLGDAEYVGLYEYSDDRLNIQASSLYRTKGSSMTSPTVLGTIPYARVSGSTLYLRDDGTAA